MEATQEHSEYAIALQKSSKLVHEWAEQGPPGEANIRALLTVDGISIWDIMAPDLALYQIPNGLSEFSGSRTFWQIVKFYLRRLKYEFRRVSVVDNSDCSSWPSGDTALLLGFTPYIARDVLHPLRDLLDRETGLIPVLLDESQALPRNDVIKHVHSIHRHRGKETAREARELSKSIRAASLTLTDSNRYTRLFEDNGRQMWPYIGNGVKNALNVYASFILPDIIAVARHILTVHRPAIIVSPDVAHPRTRAFTQIGAALGIPTVELQFGACGSEAVEWRFFKASIAAVWGEQSKEVLLSHGVPPEKIHVTGSPRHDALFGVTDREVKEFRERFSVPLENRTVVFGSTYSLKEHNSAAEIAALTAMKMAVVAAVDATPGVSLIVKPHPLEDVSQMQALATNNSRVLFAKPGEDIRSLTRVCDVFFTLGSASTLDGLILGKPTVCLAFPDWNFGELFVRTGAVMVLRSQSEVISAMGQIARDGGVQILRRHEEPRRRFLASWISNEGVGATRRVVDLLKSSVLRKYLKEI
jgi:hypothetical protein